MEYKNMELYAMIKQELGELDAGTEKTTKILQEILKILLTNKKK